jgi:CRISPR-associated protein Cas2
MLVWAIYDITVDKKRRKLARTLKDAGLYRVQKSVFLGDLGRNELDELALQCGEFVDDETDALYLFPMDRASFDLTLTLGQAFNRTLVSGELLQVVL